MTNAPRPSSLDLLMLCRASTEPCKHPINKTLDVATFGSGGHDALDYLTINPDADVEELATTYAALWDIDETDLRIALFCALKAWNKMGAFFPNPRTEVELKGRLNHGTVDVASIIGGAINDWKLGRDPPWHLWQMWSYADGFRQKYGMHPQGYILASEVHARVGEYQSWKFTDAKLDSMHDRVINRLEEKLSWYPGRHCFFCPHSASCQAKQDYERAAVKAVSALQPKALTRGAIARNWEKAKVLENVLAQFKEVAKNEVYNGPIPLPDGGRLELQEVKRTTWHTETVGKVLSQEFGCTRDEILAEIEFTKSSINKLAGLHAEKGEKGRTQAAALETIENQGGAHHYTRKQLTHVKGN